MSWSEIVTMNTRNSGYKDFTMDMFKTYLKRFFEKLQNEGEKVKSPKDAKSHFARWLKIELENNETMGTIGAVIQASRKLTPTLLACYNNISETSKKAWLTKWKDRSEVERVFHQLSGDMPFRIRKRLIWQTVPR